MKRKDINKNNAGGGVYVLLIVISTIALLIFLRSDFFAIKNIVVEGNEYVSEDTILMHSDVSIGQNIFNFK